MSKNAIPGEVQEAIGAAIDSVKAMSKEELIELVNPTLPEDKQITDPEKVTENWLRKKAKYVVQDQVLREHNVEPPKAVAERHAKVDEEDRTKGEKKAGRKRMNTSGKFIVALGSDGSLGREGSTKNKIMKGLQALNREFSYEDFQAEVKEAMQWTPKEGTDKPTEEGTFGISTKFPSLSRATSAWFSELKNKQELIAPVGAEQPTEAPVESAS